MKYIIFLLFIFSIGCDSGIKPIYISNRNPLSHADSLNLRVDSMITFTGKNKYDVYFPNYIGSYNIKFPELKYFPTSIYQYQTIKDGKFGYIDPKPAKPLLSYIFPIDLSLTIDTTQFPQSTERYFDSEMENIVETKKINSYYLFIQNNSAYEIPIIIQPPYLFLLMEATDRNKEWKPIEYITTAIPYCGTGVYEVYLKEDYYLLTKIPVYSGEFNTKIRIKINVDKKVFYSNEINMSINENQFKFPFNYLKKDSVSQRYSVLDF